MFSMQKQQPSILEVLGPMSLRGPSGALTKGGRLWLQRSRSLRVRKQNGSFQIEGAQKEIPIHYGSLYDDSQQGGPILGSTHLEQSETPESSF